MVIEKTKKAFKAQRKESNLGLDEFVSKDSAEGLKMLQEDNGPSSDSSEDEADIGEGSTP